MFKSKHEARLFFYFYDNKNEIKLQYH